jgi:hypothetical protein
MALEPEELSKVFGSIASPTAPLAFETPIDAHFDILFNRSSARADGSKTTTERATQ